MIKHLKYLKLKLQINNEMIYFQCNFHYSGNLYISILIKYSITNTFQIKLFYTSMSF